MCFTAVYQCGRVHGVGVTTLFLVLISLFFVSINPPTPPKTFIQCPITTSSGAMTAKYCPVWVLFSTYPSCRTPEAPPLSSSTKCWWSHKVLYILVCSVEVECLPAKTTEEEAPSSALCIHIHQLLLGLIPFEMYLIYSHRLHGCKIKQRKTHSPENQCTFLDQWLKKCVTFNEKSGDLCLRDKCLFSNILEQTIHSLTQDLLCVGDAQSFSFYKTLV